MEKEKNSKVMSIIALCVAVVGLSLGFAAFSSSLAIKPSATVTPNASDFVVRFSSSATGYSTGNVDPSNPALGQVATISNEDPTTISNLVAKFKEPGDTVSYTFYVRNDGKYDAYLHNIDFGTKTCTAGENAPQSSLMNAACNDIDVEVYFEDNEWCSYSEDSGYGCWNNGILRGDFSKITVKISYASDGTRADGDFNVNFDEIKLTYSTIYNNTPWVS